VELGEYSEVASLLTQKSTKDPDAFRLLGDLRYVLEDYDRSVVAYRNGIMDSSTGSLEVLSGLTNALVAAKNPNEVVQELLAAKDRLRMKQKIRTTIHRLMKVPTNQRTLSKLILLICYWGKYTQIGGTYLGR